MRKIDKRWKPPVKGIDLWQAMNYIELDEVGKDFIYNGYTSSTICYVKGSRPQLEALVKDVCKGLRDPFEKAVALTCFVAQGVKWAGFYAAQKKGKQLKLDRTLTEEQLLDFGFGWCNEQARVLCCLAQIAGIPARLVFSSSPKGKFGHVVTEVLLPNGWMLADQSMGYCFVKGNRPVNAWELLNKPAMTKHFEPIYRKLCQDLTQKLGAELLARDFAMSQAPIPLVGFESLGYCNYFV